MTPTDADLSATECPAWTKLSGLREHVAPLRALLEAPNRFRDNLVVAPQLRLDLSRQRWDGEIRRALEDLARETGVLEARADLFRANALNPTERRAVLHTALRRPAGERLEIDGVDVLAEVHEALDRVCDLAEAVREGRWRGQGGAVIEHVVNIGIGGSALGPALVCDALEPAVAAGPTVHFLTNVDGHEAHTLLAHLPAERTLFVIASKSFGTLETRVNAETARRWFLERGGSLEGIARHFVAVSTNLEAAGRFGLPQENLFPLWDWVGGRFSLWSPIGLPIALRHGADAFRRLLSGARAMDDHFRDAAPEDNAPLQLALAEIWNTNFLGTESLALLPYASALARLPDYLQQLEMESNGKGVRCDGRPVDHHTGPVLWGNVGTTGQHAYHQLLHQGTRAFSAEFVLPLRMRHHLPGHHAWLAAHCFAQAEAFARGRSVEEVRAALLADGMDPTKAAAAAPHRVLPGDHPSSLVLLEDLSPESVGALVALHEHKVFAQGMIWRVDSFDQWGVELGKVLGDRIHGALHASANDADAAIEALGDSTTQELVRIFRDTMPDRGST
ncbi:MAG: glucose-6-phosphate isomerase [Pseudomonadales bacterium]|jgi:glucose-6-phosphate isomerase|nr:glucose-6-phosphate isomerase [Pseudomonadales bacterium]